MGCLQTQQPQEPAFCKSNINMHVWVQEAFLRIISKILNTAWIFKGATASNRVHEGIIRDLTATGINSLVALMTCSPMELARKASCWGKGWWPFSLPCTIQSGPGSNCCFAKWLLSDDNTSLGGSAGRGRNNVMMSCKWQSCDYVCLICRTTYFIIYE